MALDCLRESQAQGFRKPVVGCHEAPGVKEACSCKQKETSIKDCAGKKGVCKGTGSCLQRPLLFTMKSGVDLGNLKA